MTSKTKSFRSKVQKEDENFLAEYFVSRGYCCLKLDKNSQEKSSKTPKTPDYLLEKDGLRIYCEIKSMFEQEDFAKTAEISKRLVDKLQGLNYPFDFHLRINSISKFSNLIEKEIINSVNNKLKQLKDKLPLPITIQSNDKDIEVKIKKLNKEGHLQCLSYPLGGGLIKSTQRLRNLISKSAKKFKNYLNKDSSYVLIVFNHNIFLALENFLEAIYGDRVVTFHIPSEISSEAEPLYGPNRMFTSNKNTIISAIVLCEEIKINNNSIKRFVVFHNPCTRYPLDQKIFTNGFNKQCTPIEITPDHIKSIWMGSEI